MEASASKEWNLIDRFLVGLGDREARRRRGGRIAGIGFLLGGLVAIPVNLLIDPEDAIVHVAPVVSLALGAAFLLARWERAAAWTPHVLAVGTIALISFAMAIASPAYAAYYVLIALSVALAFESFAAVLAYLALMLAGLLTPVFFGSFTGRETLIIALLEAPAVLVVGTVTALLTSRLESSREALWQQSRQDPLTGVGNYRALHERLEQEIARHARRNREFALILFDLNEFKQINERFGHLEGDAVLTGVGSVLRESVRTEDLIFRQGGDEFAVIAPETNAEEAEEVAARLRGELARSEHGLRGITAVSGFAIYPGDGRTIGELLSFADVHLLAAKRDARARDGV